MSLGIRIAHVYHPNSFLSGRRDEKLRAEVYLIFDAQNARGSIKVYVHLRRKILIPETRITRHVKSQSESSIGNSVANYRSCKISIVDGISLCLSLSRWDDRSNKLYREKEKERGKRRRKSRRTNLISRTTSEQSTSRIAVRGSDSDRETLNANSGERGLSYFSLSRFSRDEATLRKSRTISLAHSSPSLTFLSDRKTAIYIARASRKCANRDGRLRR